ncbi:MAG: potassium channel protein [Anaerolineae bacterium]|nr:potassium channel protein [Anaerolineae bacterium]
MLSTYQRLRIALSDPVRGFQLSLVLLALLVGCGTLGYMLLEGMPGIDAFYMTIITISTVGFGEVRPLSDAGRIFTSLLILVGLAMVTTAISNAVGIIMGPRLWLAIRERRMEETLKTIENHYIVCGYGRMGRQIVRDLQERREPCVVIELEPEAREELLEQNIPHIIGDGTQDEALYEAGVERAAGLVSALNSDADNVLTVLSAREINPKLFIVARAASGAAESKLRRAGANRVVSPYQIGGHRMALALIRPAVHDFMNRVFSVGDDMDMDIGQVSIKEGSILAGQTIAQTHLRHQRNVTILAIQKPDGELIINPGTQHMIEPGETLIVIGPPKAIYRIEDELDMSED